MAIGYSQQLINDNKAADKQKLGVQLGRVCIKHNISVADVSAYFGVSRQTVYNWFRGTEVRSYYRDLMIRLINSYQ
ncbi:transposase family protein [bacterium]|nr:transposase family protein [bacterium]